MEYVVSRQAPWDDEKYIEIACGRDEVSPGMLVPEFTLEGTYDTRNEAVQAAIELQETITSVIDEWPIKISAAASIGLYGQYSDELNVDELREWVNREVVSDEDEWEDEDG